jgi:hypothetical protein
MTLQLIRALDVPAAVADDEDFLRDRLALLRALEVSLERSLEAMPALDLARIELGTSEQIVLIRRLDATWGNAAERLAEDRTGALRELDSELAGELKDGLKDGLRKETRRSAQRILEALRLQAALLARARAKLRVLANMLAGPGVPYGDLLAHHRGDARVAAPRAGRP